MENRFTLSKKEKELMELFWDSDSPLARGEILERAATRKCSWKPNSVHILVNALLDKGAVRVAGYYLNSRKLGRTFESAITREDYAFMQVEQAADQAKKTNGLEPSSLVAALLGGNDVDDEEIDEMVSILEGLKKSMKKETKK